MDSARQEWINENYEPQDVLCDEMPMGYALQRDYLYRCDRGVLRQVFFTTPLEVTLMVGGSAPFYINGCGETLSEIVNACMESLSSGRIVGDPPPSIRQCIAEAIRQSTPTPLPVENGDESIG